MNIEELKEIERRLVWKCFDKRIPKLLHDIDDNVADDVIFSGGENEGNEIWMLEREDCSIVIESKANGILDMTLQEPCHKIVCIGLINPELNVEIDEQELINSISLICKTFVAGSWHQLLDYICGDDNWRSALNSYISFEEEHPEIVTQITYF